jgi:hypothetical protein
MNSRTTRFRAFADTENGCIPVAGVERPETTVTPHNQSDLTAFAAIVKAF